MGCDYIFFTEGKYNGKWVGLDVKALSIDKEENKEYKMIPTYINGSRSSFGKTYDKLRLLDESHKIDFSNLSPETRSYFYDDDDFDIEDTMEDDSYNPIVVPIQLLLSEISKSCKYNRAGFVEKSIIPQIKIGEADFDVVPMDAQEYMELPEDVREAYAFCEWSSYDYWRDFFKVIYDNAKHRISDFCEANYISDISEVRIVMFCFY